MATTKTIAFTPRQITYLLIALQDYEKRLLAVEGDAMEDGLDDVLMIQALIKKLRERPKSVDD